MCGIVGYAGLEQAAPILLNGLAKLEYRGYDSAGMAVYHDGKIGISKAKGRLEVLRQLTNDGQDMNGTVGIGHTRWATHGEPSVVNSHPQANRSRSIAVVHNGIIENYQKLRDRLMAKGYEFVSQTDTEVIAHLLDYYYKGNPLEAISKVMTRMEGSYALGILFQDFPNEIYAVRKDSPLIVGISQQGNFIASDVPAILNYSRNVYYIDNMEIVRLTADDAVFYNLDQEEIQKEMKVIEWDMEAAEKGGYEHFMLKEIYEQPKAVRDAISPHIQNGDIVFDELKLTEEEICSLSRIHIVACGSAYHAGVVGKYVIEGLARIPVEVDLASEFRYRNPIIDKNSLMIVVSQSGETADTLAALRQAHDLGAKVLGIVNVVGSSIAREADDVIYTWAGPEISVATTKAYSAQVVDFYLLAMYLAKHRQLLPENEFGEMLEELQCLPEKITAILGDRERIQWFASKYAGARDMYFIGRGIDYAVSLEGSLKLKEISYVHSEAYAAGELKHGPISLIENGVLVISVVTQPKLYDKMISNMLEVASRGGYLMSVTSAGNFSMEDTAKTTMYVPRTNPWFAATLAIIPLQLFAYYVSVAKGLDVDKPRNLAKSVTVE